MLGERIASQPEVIRAIVSDHSPRCGGPWPTAPPQPPGRVSLGKGAKDCRHSMVKPCAEFSVKSTQAPRPCAGRPLSRRFRGDPTEWQPGRAAECCSGAGGRGTQRVAAPPLRQAGTQSAWEASSNNAAWEVTMGGYEVAEVIGGYEVAEVMGGYEVAEVVSAPDVQRSVQPRQHRPDESGQAEEVDTARHSTARRSETGKQNSSGKLFFLLSFASLLSRLSHCLVFSEASPVSASLLSRLSHCLISSEASRVSAVSSASTLARDARRPEACETYARAGRGKSQNYHPRAARPLQHLAPRRNERQNNRRTGARSTGEGRLRSCCAAGGTASSCSLRPRTRTTPRPRRRQSTGPEKYLHNPR